MKTFLVYTDGGALNNPGPAGIGVVIKLQSEDASQRLVRLGRKKVKIVKEISEYIGEATNNQAEYQALIRALKEVKKLKSGGVTSDPPATPPPAMPRRWRAGERHSDGGRGEVIECKVFLDSNLVVNQMNLNYKVKHPELQPLFLQAHNLAVSLGNVKFSHIPREQNEDADRLVKKAFKLKSKAKT